MTLLDKFGNVGSLSRSGAGTQYFDTSPVEKSAFDLYGSPSCSADSPSAHTWTTRFSAPTSSSGHTGRTHPPNRLNSRSNWPPTVLSCAREVQERLTQRAENLYERSLFLKGSEHDSLKAEALAEWKRQKGRQSWVLEAQSSSPIDLSNRRRSYTSSPTKGGSVFTYQTPPMTCPSCSEQASIPCSIPSSWPPSLASSLETSGHANETLPLAWSASPSSPPPSQRSHPWTAPWDGTTHNVDQWAPRPSSPTMLSCTFPESSKPPSKSDSGYGGWEDGADEGS